MDISTIISGVATVVLFFLGWRVNKLVELVSDLAKALSDGKITQEEIKELIEDLEGIKKK